MKLLRLAGLAAFVLSIGGHARAQGCKPESFTIQDVEKIDFSDITKYAGYSVLEQKSDEQKHQQYAGSAVVYGVPVSLEL
jgi:hypothetical protein